MNVKRNNLWAALFVGPALFLTGFFLLYPSAQTIWLSLLDGRSINFVGLENYRFAFSSSVMLQAFRNNLIWMIVFTSSTVVLGLVLAIVFDKVRYESVAKTAIFMPMAISFVGAGIIWKFMYAYKPLASDQIGLLNQLVVTAGGEPRGWLIYGPLMNNLALIMVGVWTWTGFCMVILSASYKGIPKELLEAATVDGASELQRLRYIVLPFMGSTIAVVTITMIVNVLKVFDIVYVMTNGNYGTEVIANRMYKEMFQYGNYGRASAIAVVLFLLIVPIIIVNVRRIAREDRSR